MADKKMENPLWTIRVSHDLDDRVSRVADMYGLTKNDVIRVAVAQYCGQITGALDQMAKNQMIDYEKLVEVMMPKLIEAEKVLNKG